MNEFHIPPVVRHKDSVIPAYYYTSPHNVNPHPYTLLYNNPNICAHYKDVFLLLMVKSTFAHYSRRKTIRETWGAPYNIPDVIMPLVFLLGTAQHRQDISHENSIYRDIVQENFVDSYANGTLKDVMAFKWARTFCPHAKYVLIANDDVVIDIFKLVPYLQTLHQHNEDFYQFSLCYLYPCCMLAENQNQQRNASSTSRPHKPKAQDKRLKLKLEELEKTYRGKAYPAYCSDTAIVAPSLSIHNLFLMSLDTPSFIPHEPWLGVLAEKVGITFKDTFTSYVGIPAETNLIAHFSDNNYLETAIIVSVVGPSYPLKETEKMRRIWGLIIAQHRDKPPMDVHHYMGIKREKDNHIYTVAAAALCIDLVVILLIGYIIFCRKRMRPYLQHTVIYR